MKKFYIVLAGALFCSLTLFSQVPPPPGGGGDDPFNNSIPIDGGASILAAAGVAYGVKKYRDYRKGSEEDGDEIE